MELHPEVEQLLLQKPFNRLTVGEKELVSQYLSPEEYEACRLALSAAARSRHATPPPPPQLEVQLLEAFQQHHAGSKPYNSRITSLKSRRNPAWLVAAAACAGLLLGLGLSWLSFPGQPIIREIVVYHTDTVFIETPPTIHPDALLPAQLAEKRTDSGAIRTSASARPEKTTVPARTMAASAQASVSVPQQEEKKKGSSLRNDEQLLELVVKVY